MYQYNWSLTRKKAFRRDKWRCQNCGARNVVLHAHHIVPISFGGSDELYNLITLCERCHANKHPGIRLTSKYERF
jgi:5-methylcytosine-specific restriction endonuclease McrA